MPMTPQQAELWSKIAAFEIDDPASVFKFSDRLARENGWSHAYAAEVIDEYRRFVFLAFAAGHPVTPSVDVDEAWHLHLLYTRSYWDDLCRDTLGGPLHHGPTKGGRDEADKFADWYGRTLESYQRLFDRPAPASIWPDPDARFAAASRTVHVRPATHWIVRKPHIAISKWLARSKWNPTPATAALLVIASLGALAVTGCMAAGGGANGAGLPNPVTSFDAKQFLIFYPIVWIVLMALTTWFQRMLLNEPVPDETIREFQHESPETIALLQEQVKGGFRLAELLTARLFAQGRIRFDAEKKRLVRADNDPKPANAFDAEMLAVVEAGESAASPPQLASYAAEIRERPLVRSAIDRLRQKDLFLEYGPLRFAQGAAMVAILTWLAIGFARAQVGLARHRPIGFLILEMIVGGLIGLLLWVTGPVLRSRYAPAAKIVRQLKRATAGRIPALQQRLADDQAATSDDDVWRGLAIAGLCVLPATGPFHEFRTQVQPPASGDGGVDVSAGGCGGGGGGGGCGGGGCGGGGCGGCGG